MKHMLVTAGVDGIFMISLAAVVLASKGWDLYDLLSAYG